MMKRFSMPWLILFTNLTYLFLYIPIVVLIVFSFNKSAEPFVWGGCSLHWYQQLFSSPDLIAALYNSLIVACCAMLMSIFLGLCFVFYGAYVRMSSYASAFYASLATPEIVIAVGLLTLYSYLQVPLGFTTLIAGHTVLGLGYVIPVLQARFTELDKRYTEAAMDLGASPTQILRYVIVPLMLPALLVSGLLVFIISLDDFLISFFCAGSTTQTLPMHIFVLIRSGATPIVNAISTCMLIASSLIVLFVSWLQYKKMDIL